VSATQPTVASQMPGSPSNRIAVVIASVGRPTELGRWIDHARRQTVQPTSLIYAVTKPQDLPPGEQIPENVTVLFCDPGLPIQRNAGLDTAIGSSDIIAYFDDDYVPSSYCIADIDAFFAAHPDVVGANGMLLADGINSAGIDYDEAAKLVASRDAQPRSSATSLQELGGLYGCNMVYRTSAIGEDRFDEKLPLYAWQEDIDFAARIARRGRLVKTDAFYGVHQGVKGARLPGIRLGYSQIVNPVYLARKGTLPPRDAARMMIKNVLVNHLRAPFPEPWIDRLGRAKGNRLAIWDILWGRDHPKNILTFSNKR
jgi:hypothetical protein